ncbi:MAG: hypothetical protein ACI8WB_003391 [Phenylobacterium sp.]|jgi:hypothetical protein
MEDNATNHALTEVALALAMAFFAIMILAMVSMNVPSDNVQVAHPPLDGDQMALVETKAEADHTEQPSDQQTQAAEQTYLFYFNDHYYDQQLNQVIPATLPQGGKIVLALPPSLTVDKAMAIQAKINRPDLVITQLNPQWLQRLETL